MIDPMSVRGGRPRIGDLLLGEGVLSEAGLERALAAQLRTRREIRLGSALIGIGVLTEDALLGALSRANGCAAVSSAELMDADPLAVALLPSARALRLGAMPYAVEKKMVRVAFSDPSNIAALDEVAAVTGRRVVPAVTSEVRLMQAHEKFYGRPISRHFATILKRLDAPPVEKPTPVVPPVAVAPPPPPRFREEDPTQEEAAELPLHAAPIDESRSHDPFSDEYSLADFLAQALEGVSLEDLWSTAGFDEDFPLDLGEPLSDADEGLENTQPTRQDSDPQTGVDPIGFGALA